MSAITFKTANAEVVNTAKNDNKLSRGFSPFQDGTTFKVTGYDFVSKIEDGVKDATTAFPVLKTTIGDLFLSSILRPRVTIDGKKAESKGDATDAIKKCIAENRDKTDGEILEIIVKELKDHEIVVKRTEYAAPSKYRAAQFSATIDLHFKK